MPRSLLQAPRWRCQACVDPGVAPKSESIARVSIELLPRIMLPRPPIETVVAPVIAPESRAAATGASVATQRESSRTSPVSTSTCR
jgi:hypothetical protein